MTALPAFGAPAQDVIEADFARPGVTCQIAVAPVRSDILPSLPRWRADAWAMRAAGRFGDVEVNFIGGDAFIRNRRATGRTRDLADIEGFA